MHYSRDFAVDIYICIYLPLVLRDYDCEHVTLLCAVLGFNMSYERIVCKVVCLYFWDANMLTYNCLQFIETHVFSSMLLFFLDSQFVVTAWKVMRIAY